MMVAEVTSDKDRGFAVSEWKGPERREASLYVRSSEATGGIEDHEGPQSIELLLESQSTECCPCQPPLMQDIVQGRPLSRQSGSLHLRTNSRTSSILHGPAAGMLLPDSDIVRSHA